jgi:plastocyanin
MASARGRWLRNEPKTLWRRKEAPFIAVMRQLLWWGVAELMRQKRHLAWVLVPWLCAAALQAQTATLRGRVVVPEAKSRPARTKPQHGKVPATVVWLTPAPGSGIELAPPVPANDAHPQLVQKNKSFEPHLLVVPAGTTVEFPNHDPFFHNVFSLFEGKRFDLGLYEAGTSRMVRFDRPGISYIFCNIHPQMSAVVITMATPLYAVTRADGQVSIAKVPYGRYMLHIWSEGMGPENATPETREITIGENASSLGVIRVPEASGQRMAHKNKYGREYDAPTPDSSIYEQQ